MGASAITAMIVNPQGAPTAYGSNAVYLPLHALAMPIDASVETSAARATTYLKGAGTILPTAHAVSAFDCELVLNSIDSGAWGNNVDAIINAYIGHTDGTVWTGSIAEIAMVQTSGALNGGAITTLSDYKVNAISFAAGATIGTRSGFYIPVSTLSSAGLPLSGYTTVYGLNIQDTAPNYLAGALALGGVLSTTSIVLNVGTGAYASPLTINAISDGAYVLDLENPGHRSWGVQLSGNSLNIRSNASSAVIISLNSSNAVAFPGISTTAAAPNAFLDSSNSNNLLRSTSSVRYKRDIDDLDSIRVDTFIDRARPVYYRSRAAADNPAWSWYGLIAEEVAEIDPRLVHWGYQEWQHRIVKNANGEVRELVPGSQKMPEGVMYDRTTVFLIDAVRRLRARVSELEAE